MFKKIDDPKKLLLRVARLNDERKFSFERIADVIELLL
jgi:hypothetical protein